MKLRLLRLVWSFCFLGLLLPQNTKSQDYPYEETETKPSNSRPGLPRETPGDLESSTPNSTGSRSANAIFRTQFKIGTNWNLVQTPIDNQSSGNTVTSGLGAEGLFGFGWDLKGQKTTLEFESGYRALFLTETEKFHIIPINAGLYYRHRMGPRSLFRFGLKSGLDLRYTSYITGNGSKQFSWGIFPVAGISTQIELNGFLIEPIVFVNRIQTDLTFFGASLRFGFVF